MSVPPRPSALRAARLALVGVVGTSLVWGIVTWSWWSAQESGRQTAGLRGFVVGDPFPWGIVAYPMLLTLGCGVFAMVQLRKARRSRRDAPH